MFKILFPFLNLEGIMEEENMKKVLPDGEVETKICFLLG